MFINVPDLAPLPLLSMGKLEIQASYIISSIILVFFSFCSLTKAVDIQTSEVSHRVAYKNYQQLCFSTNKTKIRSFVGKKIRYKIIFIKVHV